MMQTQAVIRHISRWLADYAVRAGAKGFVVDSAVVSALCAHSGLDVLCVVLPIRQQADQLQRANEHIADLQHRFINVRSQTLDLTPTFEQFERSVADTAAANQACCRAFATACCAPTPTRPTGRSAAICRPAGPSCATRLRAASSARANSPTTWPATKPLAAAHAAAGRMTRALPENPFKAFP